MLAKCFANFLKVVLHERVYNDIISNAEAHLKMTKTGFLCPKVHKNCKPSEHVSHVKQNMIMCCFIFLCQIRSFFSSFKFSEKSGDLTAKSFITIAAQGMFDKRAGYQVTLDHFGQKYHGTWKEEILVNREYQKCSHQSEESWAGIL